MRFLNIFGRILSFITSIFIMVSVFITTINIKVLNISIYSMDLFEYNRVGSVIIIGLAVICLLCSYFNKGLVISVLSIVILVMDFYTASTLNTGSSAVDTTMNKIGFLFGDIFFPEAGFILVIIGSIILFFAGIMINKSKNVDKKVKVNVPESKEKLK